MLVAWQSTTLLDGLTGNFEQKVMVPRGGSMLTFLIPSLFTLMPPAGQSFYLSSELSQHLLDESAQYFGSFQMMNPNDIDYSPDFSSCATMRSKS